jgi:hypothetical protein
MNRQLFIGIGIMAVIALATVGMRSESSSGNVVASSCEETPGGNVEHCSFRDNPNIEQGGGASVQTPAGEQAGQGGQFAGCTGGSGFHEGAPNNEPVGSGGNGLNCD